MRDITKKKKIPDQELIAGIKKEGVTREQYINHLYERCQGFVRRGQSRYKLSEETAIDAYTDAFVIVINRIKANIFRGESKITSYFYKVFCNKCIDAVRAAHTQKQQYRELTDLFPNLPDGSQDLLLPLIMKDKMKELRHWMNKLSERCRELILQGDYMGYSNKELALQFGYQNAESVATQKKKCKQKLRELYRVGR